MQDTLQLQKTNEVRKKNHFPQKNFALQLSFDQLRFSENKSIKKKKCLIVVYNPPFGRAVFLRDLNLEGIRITYGEKAISKRCK